MELQEFIENFADLFEDTPAEEITAETEFQTLDEWDSMTALVIIGMAKTQYGKDITGREIRSCTTVEDLYNLVASK